MVADTIPLFVSLACLCSEVGEKIDLLFVLVEETELLVNKRLHTNTSSSCRGCGLRDSNPNRVKYGHCVTPFGARLHLYKLVSLSYKLIVILFIAN